MSNIYESDKLLAEYLLFHFGLPGEICPYPFGPLDALDYAVRCVSECLDTGRLPDDARALDLGCAVGRSSFELARHCGSVTGIDFSKRFIEAALHLRDHGHLPYTRIDEGELGTPLVARVPADIDRTRLHFETGDATALREDLGLFDVVLMANLVDRLREPKACLSRLAGLVKSGGQLIVTSPYTWLPEFTPHPAWLGGFTGPSGPQTTMEGLKAELAGDFELVAVKDLPFLIREHARKFQWSVAQATCWIRR